MTGQGQAGMRKTQGRMSSRQACGLRNFPACACAVRVCFSAFPPCPCQQVEYVKNVIRPVACSTSLLAPAHVLVPALLLLG
jgi:hypothetical protein